MHYALSADLPVKRFSLSDQVLHKRFMARQSTSDNRIASPGAKSVRKVAQMVMVILAPLWAFFSDGVFAMMHSIGKL
jgi:hypothetical protein